ncbi:MAG: hypothetical protein Q8O99_06765 [bacterium]|nr:hypothetical protein [bacterium]
MLTYSPVFSSTFPENLQQIILNNLEYLYIEDFLKFKKTEIETMLKKVLQLNNHGEYVISDKDKTIIMRRIKRLLVNKRQEYESVVKKTK